ncbi:NAD-dependent epimerase/dehydratase family protein [Enterovirga aerilata]|uniref:NAD-dependent epimerase/dehydratase family protein n=1 Tax=Enterovirga aerilata TaxID=2730920 RepID=A0A849IAU5_9HYPH|nr:NAD-dependent epimerase/dehydratase family protein [Enterovirga sp. DB1703]NNM74528.1 NAD-dependent epimerase/dehydratase family protein [Enterovirga sp. DB1703]
MNAGAAGFCIGDLEEAVGHASGALRDLDGSSLFLTGGTGFFGRWLLAVLDHARMRLGLRLQVTLLSRRPEAFAEAHPHLASLGFLRLVAGDVRSFSFPSRKFSHIIHAATDTSAAAGRDPADLIGSVVDGTRRVLELAARCEARRLLYVSSGAVYGPQPPGMAALAEEYSGAPDPLDPRSSYGQAKRLAEHLCALAADRTGIETVIARAFAFVGPGLPLDGHFAIGNFIRDALAGKEISVGGDGTPVRSYLYAGDLAAWLPTLLAKGRPGRAYNVGSDREIRIAELARLVGSVIPGSGEIVIRGEPDPAATRNRYVPSIERARTELALDSWTPLDEAIRRTARYARGEA